MIRERLSAFVPALADDHNITKIIMTQDLLHTAAQYTLVICIAVVAVAINTYVTVFLTRKKFSRTVKNDCYGYYLMHMFVVEIVMSMLCIPATIVDNKRDDETRIFYKYASVLKIFGSSLCIGTSTSMTIQRLLGANKALRKRKSKRNLKYSLVFVWIWGLANTVPFSYIFDDLTIPDVHVNTPAFQDRVHLIILLCSVFALPSLVTLVCCVNMLRLHRDGSALMLKRRKQYQTFVAMSILLTVSFVFTVLPEYLFLIVSSKNETSYPFVVGLSWLYLVLHPIIFYLKIVKNTKPEKSSSKPTRRMSVLGGMTEQTRNDTSHNIPTLDHEERRSSIFERRNSSAVSAADVDAVLRRFSQNISEHDGLDFHSLNSCISHLDNLNRAKRKVSLLERIRRLGTFQVAESSILVDEEDCSSSLLPLPYPRVVHKLNQKER